MKDLGDTHHILGMRVTRDRKEGLLYLSQEEYVSKVLECFSICRVGDQSVLHCLLT